jgi:hypothetical protein
MDVVHKSDTWEVVQISYTKWMLHPMGSLNFLVLGIMVKCATPLLLNHWVASHWLDFIGQVGNVVCKMRPSVYD